VVNEKKITGIAPNYLNMLRLCDSIQIMPALKVNIIIVHSRGVVFPRENNIPRVNNYDVHCKYRQ
jgi:hypothetical protein